ncbi:HAD family phosphatase [Aliiroseovarius subalbicans]|uniref:HAD family hydrolase n=1 Tax=Aliiroseovarius subalbicans TaxID=2925840 RepID=UPI001F59DB98|nr:HAD family phosphatase [Aliiroseovarius subalbicans]MCI2399765.1 HAD family phosphatase [Aliiroseovarius subalbicans]
MDTHLLRPKAVIFDIGNVLITWQPEQKYDRWIGEERRRAMFSTVDLHGMNEQVDAGGDFRQVIYDTAAQYPEFAKEIRWWHDRWLDLATPVIDLSLRSFRALKAQGVPVFALSNFGRGSFSLSESRDHFLAEFDRRYISGHMGVTKPNPRIYEMVEQDCGIAPEHLLFVDDRAENIAAAEARGWQGHVFTSPEGWVAHLIAAGLLQEGDL